MQKEIYFKHFNTKDADQIITNFHDTIVDTNRGYNFFVDWEKVRDNVSVYKIEFNILNSLIGSKNFDAELRCILAKYPEVLPTIPILLAIREIEFKVIQDFAGNEQDFIEYDFAKRKLKSEDIDKIAIFFKKTGLEHFFQNLSSKSIQDYVTGVEVGMDTHARKNRSGVAMELAMKPIIDEISSQVDTITTVLFQKKFKYLENLKIPVPSALKERKADFLVIKEDESVINIEVNFYSGTGSKPQEIVDSYINRQNELKENGFDFIWVTDGYGWSGQKNQIAKGFDKVDYLLNLHFSRKGLLKEILCRI